MSGTPILSSSPESEISWIEAFCAQEHHTFFCEVSKAFMLDPLNLAGLPRYVRHFKEALNVIEDNTLLIKIDDPNERVQAIAKIGKYAKTLYGLIHARYILTEPGIDQMCEKFRRGDFGYCPRVYCKFQKVLPIGLSDDPGKDSVKLYCPKCMEVFNIERYKHIDGAFFGTRFPHVFFMVLPDQRPPPPKKKYIPSMHPCAYELQTNGATNPS
ncbi:casein kinase II subunit beta-like isoform X1 [Zophobas morio]|uniref:casein kinase II subunit beta-like isoform X1 n=2 Tax=Zophobas morio TaxID=2755281 RepID=UPI003082EDFF